jgi:hypothetical protein
MSKSPIAIGSMHWTASIPAGNPEGFHMADLTSNDLNEVLFYHCRLVVTLVASFTGGSILITGPSTVGGKPPPGFIRIRWSCGLIGRFCFTCAVSAVAASVKASSPTAVL